MEKICPFCNKKYKRLGSHFYKCEKLKNYSENEIHIINLKYQTNDNNILTNICNDYNNLYSLPDLKEKYGLCYKHIYWTLNYCNIPIRGISESQHKISKQKIKETCLKKYGYENPSQVPEIKRKKEETFIKHYGVDNIWKTKDYSKFTSNRWKNMSIEQKEQIITKKWVQGGYISDIEIRVYNLLKQIYNIVEPQYVIEGSKHKYDIYIHDINTIFEVNGDYWHLNPKKYKENDFIKIGNYKITAKNKWEIDKKHIEYAKKNNYNIYTIWEDDIISRNDDELINFIYNLINNKYGKTKT